MKKIIYFCLLILFTFLGCKKYPEGPLVSFYTKRHRVMQNGKLIKYVVGGIDSTNLLPIYMFALPSGDSGLATYEFWFTKEKSGASYGMNSSWEQGTWFFDDHKKNIIIRMGSAPYSFLSYKNIFIDSHSRIWRIKKLRNEEMKIEALNNSGKLVELTFGNH